MTTMVACQALGSVRAMGSTMNESWVPKPKGPADGMESRNNLTPLRPQEDPGIEGKG
ncbi:hypothetical protein GCM10008997_05130 [Halomonas salifodinae]